MGLGSTGLDAQPHAGAISCQIEPQEMGTDGHCTVQLRTWGRNISPPAPSLPSYSLSKHETNCAQQRGKSNRKSGATHQRRDTTCSVGPKGPHFLDTLCQRKYSQSQQLQYTVPKEKTWWACQTVWWYHIEPTTRWSDWGYQIQTHIHNIYITEVTCTDDSPDSLLRARVKKMCTYNALLHALRRAFPQYVVKQQNYVIGIQGSINEQQWRQQLTELRMNSHQQDKTIQKCIAASMRGTHAVASSSEKQGNDGWQRWPRNARTHSGNVYIHIYTIYSMSHITHVNKHTHTHTLLSFLLLD